MKDDEILSYLGGTAVVARLCRVKMAAVSNWRRKGMPEDRRLFLMLLVENRDLLSNELAKLPPLKRRRRAAHPVAPFSGATSQPAEAAT